MIQVFPGKVTLLFSPRWKIELVLKHQFCQQDETGTLGRRHAREFISIADRSEHVLPNYGKEKKKSFKCYFPVVFLCVASIPTAPKILSSDRISLNILK